MRNSSELIEETDDNSDFEKKRIRALNKYFEAETLPVWEKSLDRLVNLAAQICEVPISYISLVGKQTNYQQACYGFSADTIPREQSLCQYTILQDELLEISDAKQHPKVRDNSFVTGDFNLGFYAGMPLKNPEGYNIGTLCVIDHQTRNLTDHQKQALKTLADEVVAHFELKSARTELEELNQQKDELIRIVSHDMRNPLMGIIGFSELLQEEITDEQHREMLEQIEESGFSMMGIINVLLNSEYIKNEAFTLYRKQVDIAEITQQVIQLHRPFKLMKEQKLAVDFDQPLICKVDPEKWKQIVGNLLNNAIKYTAEGGSIRIKAHLVTEPRKALELTVIDNGIGMPDEIKSNLFSGSKSILRSGTEGENSSGLGMQLVKKYVDLHSGQIEVYSAEDAGTEFCIRLPV